MQLHRAVESEMFPHFLVTLQWLLLVTSLAFNLNFPGVLTGAVAKGGLKVITCFHVLMFLFPAILFLAFCKTRREGIIERTIIGLSIVTILFSAASISLHFVNEFLSLMKTAEVVAWSLYNCMFSMSIYKMSMTFLLPILRTYEKAERERLGGDEKI